MPAARLLIGIALLASAPATLFAQNAPPFPRLRLPAQAAARWEFDQGAEGWQAAHDAEAAVEDGLLRIRSTGGDPYLIGPPLPEPLAGPLVVRMRVRCRGAGGGQWFWTAVESPRWSERQSARFPLAHDGRWREVQCDLDARGRLTRLRLDPGAGPGQIDVDWIELAPLRLHPLELARIACSGSTIRLRVRNHASQQVAAAVAGRRFVAPANDVVEIAVDAPGESPFAVRRLEIRSLGLPPLAAVAVVCREKAGRQWIERRAGSLTLEAAPDGSGARLLRGGRLVALLAPLVHFDGRMPQFAPRAASAGDDAIRFQSPDAEVVLQLHEDQLAVSIRAERECEGPVVRPIGRLEQGLFAGLEYLGQDEQSSSTLDIETEEHWRYAPDPIKVTMPLMACRTSAGLTALGWDDMALRPVFAAPNFLDGPPGHRMALRGRTIDAVVRVTDEPLEEAIAWAARRRGLPPSPPPPRTRDQQWALCLRALRGPLQNDQGWGHCAEPKWVRRPFADMASTIFRLTGECPELPQLVPGGAHIRNHTAYFVTGRAAEWLEAARRQAENLMRQQQPDGSWRYRGEYQRGHFEDTSSGHCASRAAQLLEYAYYTGDPQALQAGMRALEYMKRFRTPRGAQTWELSLHTPDILAAAHLVRAYVLGYQLTGREACLQLARKWALSGVPFVYQWGDRPVMRYATIPVYGATNWRAPNWIGLPVQWCGLVYAYAVNMLAPYDDTLDWKQLAEGILIAGEQMQYPDGPLAGCLPDVFRLESQERAGPSINPCALVSLRLAVEGELDSLAVAADGGRRVASPFPVTLRGGRAEVAAAAGLHYQLLVDGSRVVDVSSAGRDVVVLPR